MKSKNFMCGNCKGCESKGGCSMHMITKILVIVGGINWGLVGLGMLLGKTVVSWNLVNMLLGSMPTAEAIVYVLVGVSAVLMMFHCKCGKCMGGKCEESKMEGMGGTEQPKM